MIKPINKDDNMKLKEKMRNSITQDDIMKSFVMIQKKRESKPQIPIFNDKKNEELKKKEKDNIKKESKVEENNFKAKLNIFNSTPIQIKENTCRNSVSNNNNNNNLKKSINSSNFNTQNNNNNNKSKELFKNNMNNKDRKSIPNKNTQPNNTNYFTETNKTRKISDFSYEIRNSAQMPQVIMKPNNNNNNNINKSKKSLNQITKPKNNNNLSNNNTTKEIKSVNNNNLYDNNKNVIKKVNSLNNYNCKNNITKELVQKDLKEEIKKKTKSIKSKISKMNIDNFSSIKYKDKYNLYDEEELDEVMQINDEKSRISKKELSKVKRTKTSDSEKNQKEQILLRKRHSLLDDNNSLTIKLPSKENYTKDDFEVITFIGKGAYGTVLKVCLKKDPNKIYAIKKLDINSLFSVNRLYQAYLENDILRELDNPYIVKIYGAFEAEGKIHLVMDFFPKGDLSYFLKNNNLKDDIIRFYAAEMVLFLEYMQSKNLVHRDLKPQNIMIDEKGHLKVIDFGTVRKLGFYYDRREMKFKEEKAFERLDSEDIKGVKNIVNPDEEDADVDDYDDEDEDEEDEDDDENNDNENKENNKNDLNEKKIKKIQKVRARRSMTFVGTAEYISPEVIGDRPAEFGTDIWAFGVMLYEMYFKTTPFKAITPYLTFRNIEKPQIKFPEDIKVKDDAKDLILKILVAEPKKRLGGGEPNTQYDIANLKKHHFFKGIKWKDLHNINPPGYKNYKYYECKKKSIYKDDGKKDISDGYVVFDDNSKRNRSSNIRIIKEGIIKKKSTWFHYEKKKIILDSTPRIILSPINDPKTQKEILLDKKCKVTIVDDTCFDLKVHGKTYRFKKNTNDENNWVELIFDTIEEYGK